MQCEQMAHTEKTAAAAAPNENTLFILIPFRFDSCEVKEQWQTFSASC